jgi:hypothetical protein
LAATGVAHARRVCLIHKMYSNKMSAKENDEVALTHEFWDRLCAYRTALRSAFKWGTPRPEKMDINTMAYMVAIEIGGKRSFDKILSELVANQDALRPDVRRFLLKRLRLRAEARRRQGQLELAAANHWDALANQFKEDVTPQTRPPAWLNRRASEPADPEFSLV